MREQPHAAALITHVNAGMALAKLAAHPVIAAAAAQHAAGRPLDPARAMERAQTDSMGEARMDGEQP